MWTKEERGNTCGYLTSLALIPRANTPKYNKTIQTLKVVCYYLIIARKNRLEIKTVK